MAMTKYSYEKLCDSGRLSQEIKDSAIVHAEDHIETFSSPALTDVYMKDALSTGDEDILDALVAAHVNEPLPENEIQAVTIEGPKDTDGSLISRTKLTKTGWRYDPRSLDWVTAKRASLYNKKPDGFSLTTNSDIGDAVLRFYDAAGTELVQGAQSDADYQTAITANCTATAVDWQTTYDMDVIGATITISNSPANPAYFWAIAAPDIPEFMGGKITFGNGGFNLSHLNSKDKLEINGRSAKTIFYDPVYNSNKFRLFTLHDVGVQIGLQLFFEHYRG